MAQHIEYPDIASYQAGISLDGMAAVVVKATEGTSYVNPDYARVAADATRRGIPWAAYHFLHSNLDLATQAKHFHDVAGNTPAMLDVEPGGPTSMPGVSHALAFAAALRALGGRPRLVYFPHWYWQELGQPDLRPLAAAGLALVSSDYTTYSDTGPGWAPYGGVTPAVWQYTNAPLDMNAYRGTVEQFRALLEGDPVLDLTQVIATASTPDVPNRNLGQVLGDTWHDVHIQIPAQIAEQNKTIGLLMTMVQTIVAGGTSLDTAAVIKAIQDSAAAESALVTDLRGKLVAAQQAAAAAMGAA